MVLTILILGVLGDSYYKSAMEQLSDISIYKTNFTQIIENLEYSSYLGNFEATAKLGEIYLIGLPISP